MKILNESNLIHFSTSSTPTTKEGWLQKRGEVNKSFQKRWFVLKGNLLFYFDKPSDTEPSGVIILEGYTVELTDPYKEPYTFQICFNGAPNLRKYILLADSQREMEAWMKAMTCAGYDYMKAMVSSLRSQIDELNSTKQQREQTIPNDRLAETFEESVRTSNSASNSPRRTRRNPFDHPATELDPFGAVPFNPSSPRASPKPTRAAPRIPDQSKATRRARSEFYAPTEQLKLTPSSSPFSPSSLSQPSKFLPLHTQYGQAIRQIQNSMRSRGADLTTLTSPDTTLLDF